MIFKAQKIEIKPTNKQQTYFFKCAGIARKAYNWGLGRRIEEYKATGKSSNAIVQHKQLNALKDSEFPYMREVSKCIPQEALRNLDAAYRRFFKEKKGFPKFKKKGVRDSFSVYRAKLNGKTIVIPRLGAVKLKEESKVIGDVSLATISRNADRWFVSFHYEFEPVVTENKDPMVGLDLGLSTFATLSTGEKIYAPKPLNRLLPILQRRSRQHSRKVKGSMNRKKSALSLSRLHMRIANVRKDFTHKLSTRLAKTKQAVIVETLNVKGMVKNHKLARSIMDAGWSEFLRQLKYKAAWYGSKIIEVGQFFPSSKRCSDCGNVKETLLLSEREYHCDLCGMRKDRDYNAALNLLNTVSLTGINACGDGSAGNFGYETAVCEAGI